MPKTVKKSKKDNYVSKELPSGFSDVSGSKDFAPFFTFEPGGILTGEVKSIKSVEMTNTFTGKKEPRNVMEVITSEGVFAVSESAAMSTLFSEAKTGNSVYIKENGVKKGKGKRKFHSFICGLKK